MAPPNVHGKCECWNQFVSEAALGNETMLHQSVLTHVWPKAQAWEGIVPFAMDNLPSGLRDNALKLFIRHVAWDTAEKHPRLWDVALVIAAGRLSKEPVLPLRHVGI